MSAATIDRPVGQPVRDGNERRPAGTAKAVAAVLSAVILVAVLSPVIENWRRDPNDSFPLSYYPMFTDRREEVPRFNHVIGRDGQGNRITIPYSYIGSGGMNQVRRQINRSVSRGDAPRLCQAVASRLARTSRAPYADVRSLEVVTGSYRLATYFGGGDKTPVDERVRAICQVSSDRR
jgi:hypothetical protein